MQITKLSLTLFLGLLLLNSCLKDRAFPPPPDNNASPIEVGDLLLNELVASGSNQTNEFGATEDWFEIYNPSASDTIFLGANRWYFSDDPAQPSKYLLKRDTFIAPQSFLVVWCDGLDTIANEIHANFGLSGSGESVIMTYVDSDGLLAVIDSITYSSLGAGNSYGRETDGATNWIEFTTPTIGAQNAEDTTPPPPPPPPTDSISSGSLYVNEIVAKGSAQANEYGTNEDWFEIYNPSTTDTIFLIANRWAFEDDGNSWILARDTFIAPQSFMVVWCDGLDTIETQIHTSFNLGGGGDEVHLKYTSDSGTTLEVDAHVFGAQTAGESIGRSPDGSVNWTSFSTPTLGASNP